MSLSTLSSLMINVAKGAVVEKSTRSESPKCTDGVYKCQDKEPKCTPKDTCAKERLEDKIQEAHVLIHKVKNTLKDIRLGMNDKTDNDSATVEELKTSSTSTAGKASEPEPAPETKKVESNLNASSALDIYESDPYSGDDGDGGEPLAGDYNLNTIVENTEPETSEDDKGDDTVVEEPPPDVEEDKEAEEEAKEEEPEYGPCVCKKAGFPTILSDLSASDQISVAANSILSSAATSEVDTKEDQLGEESDVESEELSVEDMQNPQAESSNVLDEIQTEEEVEDNLAESSPAKAESEKLEADNLEQSVKDAEITVSSVTSKEEPEDRASCVEACRGFKKPKKDAEITVSSVTSKEEPEDRGSCVETCRGFKKPKNLIVEMMPSISIMENEKKSNSDKGSVFTNQPSHVNDMFTPTHVDKDESDFNYSHMFNMDDLESIRINPATNAFKESLAVKDSVMHHGPVVHNEVDLMARITAPTESVVADKRKREEEKKKILFYKTYQVLGDEAALQYNGLKFHADRSEHPCSEENVLLRLLQHKKTPMELGFYLNKSTQWNDGEELESDEDELKEEDSNAELIDETLEGEEYEVHEGEMGEMGEIEIHPVAPSPKQVPRHVDSVQTFHTVPNKVDKKFQVRLQTADDESDSSEWCSSGSSSDIVPIIYPGVSPDVESVLIPEVAADTEPVITPEVLPATEPVITPEVLPAMEPNMKSQELEVIAEEPVDQPVFPIRDDSITTNEVEVQTNARGHKERSPPERKFTLSNEPPPPEKHKNKFTFDFKHFPHKSHDKAKHPEKIPEQRPAAKSAQMETELQRRISHLKEVRDSFRITTEDLSIREEESISHLSEGDYNKKPRPSGESNFPDTTTDMMCIGVPYFQGDMNFLKPDMRKVPICSPSSPALDCASRSITLDESMSEGEIRCRCAVSLGEIHDCMQQHEASSSCTRVEHALHKYKLPEDVVRKAFGDPTIKITGQRMHYANWISYYLSKGDVNDSSSAS